MKDDKTKKQICQMVIDAGLSIDDKCIREGCKFYYNETCLIDKMIIEEKATSG